jgi:GH24 family phage-related lysozyme (muramidase)
MPESSIGDLFANDDATPRNVRALFTEVIKWEGCRREMYAGPRGGVRTGVGHPLADGDAALALPWIHRSTGRPATAAAVRIAFAQARAQCFGHAAPAHQRASDLVLPAGLAGDLAAARLDKFILPGLRLLSAGFDRYPVGAQRALVDMAWNLGLRGLAKFHNLIAACRRGDFAAAADHCHRRSCHSARNVSTRNLFRAASAEVAAARSVGAAKSGQQRLVSASFVSKNARLDGGRR